MKFGGKEGLRTLMMRKIPRFSYLDNRGDGHEKPFITDRFFQLTMGKIFETLPFNSSAISKPILMKFGMSTLSGSQNVVAKTDFKNPKRLPWKSGKTALKLL